HLSGWMEIFQIILSCPVCQDIFKDPVLLPCSHSFCNVCVQQWWRTKQTRVCPVCKAVSPRSNIPPRNLVLKNLCEAFLLEVESGVVCRLHTERLKLYCVDHQTPVCIVCRDSSQHRNHTFTPVNEAAEFHRNGLLKLKAKWEKTDEDIKNQAGETERKVREEFRVLRTFLQEEENVRIAALKQEEIGSHHNHATLEISYCTS
uniref:RING-type domain-containing protein n=1 Tax=Seriola dumerili TaxID=41447 RepID=A0A3B4U7T2_SERDU